MQSSTSSIKNPLHLLYSYLQYEVDRGITLAQK